MTAGKSAAERVALKVAPTVVKTADCLAVLLVDSKVERTVAKKAEC